LKVNCDFDYNPPMDRRTKLLPLIAAFKIVKACSLFALAFGFHHLRDGNATATVLEWCRMIRVDPDDRFTHLIISRLTGLPPARLHELAVGTFFYGVLFGIEGMGLLLKQKWAEYMTVISTLTFLPLEGYELIVRPHHKAVKAVILLINLAILVYLAVNLRKRSASDAEVPAAAVSAPPLG